MNSDLSNSSRKKIQKEWAYLDVFKSHVEELKEVVPKKTESPDFIFQFSDRRVGVEITELLSTTLRPKEGLEDLIIKSAFENYRLLDDCPPLKVYFTFSSQVKMKKKEIGSVGLEVALALEAILKSHPDRSFNIINPVRFVRRINVTVLDEGSQSIWGPIRTAFIPEIEENYLQARMDAKSSKVFDYRKKCGEVWLLIAVEGFQPSSWYDFEGKAVTASYSSNFDRVYVLDYKNNSIYRLVLKNDLT